MMAFRTRRKLLRMRGVSYPLSDCKVIIHDVPFSSPQMEKTIDKAIKKIVNPNPHALSSHLHQTPRDSAGSGPAFWEDHHNMPLLLQQGAESLIFYIACQVEGQHCRWANVNLRKYVCELKCLTNLTEGPW